MRRRKEDVRRRRLGWLAVLLRSEEAAGDERAKSFSKQGRPWELKASKFLLLPPNPTSQQRTDTILLSIQPHGGTTRRRRHALGKHGPRR
jgi:hypothetical protein